MKPKSPTAGRARAAAALAVLAAVPHLAIVIAAGAALLALLAYAGIALPAVWSSSPARRRAARAVLSEVLGAPARRFRG
ncbi:hypothetical protein GCM10009527_065070 [Actinomadura nitritigenes]|uniref:Uncharacterized protein n=1 Tax=Actinomadura nitritigenes TaxID=134602 RepID=A0ABS3R1P7_9ACTN|nr:hypothetical protein [Actinomadura nitritigenes]MBO2440178.1 hypothetical protein [Actinomadura nitritigenes]